MYEDCMHRRVLANREWCYKYHGEADTGYCDECPSYFPRANPTPLNRVFCTLPVDIQQQVIHDQYKPVRNP